MYQSTWAVITKYRRLVSLNSADISFLIGLEAKSSCSDWQQTLFLRVPLFLVVDGCLLAVASQGVFSAHRENFGVSSSCYKGRPCAQSLQSCLTLCDPMTVARQAPPCPWDSPGKDAGVGAMPSSRGSSRPRDGTRVSRLLFGQASSSTLVPPANPCFEELGLHTDGFICP